MSEASATTEKQTLAERLASGRCDLTRFGQFTIFEQRQIIAALRSLPEREEIARVLTRALFKAEFEVMTSWTQKDMRDAADAVIAHLSGCEQQVESDK
jgi:3-methyladenine DNA glycosylase Tag